MTVQGRLDALVATMGPERVHQAARAAVEASTAQGLAQYLDNDPGGACEVLGPVDPILAAALGAMGEALNAAIGNDLDRLVLVRLAMYERAAEYRDAYRSLMATRRPVVNAG